MVLVGALALPVQAQDEVVGFGSNPGGLRMFAYVPANLPANAPLVVALHGCAEDAVSFGNETGWRQLADRLHFALLLPQQSLLNNAARCFNWFSYLDTTRGFGEAASIKQMVDRMQRDHAIATGRIYITGLSAGGAMTASMLAAYPDVFAGGALFAGIPAGCARTVFASTACQTFSVNWSPALWGAAVRAATSWAGPWPIMSIWHGNSDFVVNPLNQNESMEQWTNVHGIDQTPDVVETVAGYPHRVYTDGAGRALVETYTITGMGHGVPISPGSGPDQCGTPDLFILDVGLCASARVAQFWGL